jgi:hypothetical protein
MRKDEAAIYLVAPALVAAIPGMAFVFWSDFIALRTSYIRHIHGGAIFFFLLLALVIGAAGAAVALIVFARMIRARRLAVFVATLPFISILVSALLLYAAMLR